MPSAGSGEPSPMRPTGWRGRLQARATTGSWQRRSRRASAAGAGHRSGPRAAAARLLRHPPHDLRRTPAGPRADRHDPARRARHTHPAGSASSAGFRPPDHPCDDGHPMLIRLLRAQLRTYLQPLLLVVALQLAGTMASLYLPSLNADIIDRGIARGDTGYIVSVGGWMLVVALVQIVCSIAAVYFGARTAMGFGRDVRTALFHRVGEFSVREVNHFGAPSLITRGTNDVQQVQMLVLMTCTMMVAAPIMCFGGVAMALREDTHLSWLMLVCVPVLVVAIGALILRMMPGFRAMQSRIDEGNRVVREQITGIRVVRAFVREPQETARFGTANAELTDVATYVGRLQALIFPIVMLVLNLSSVAVLWFGAGRIDAGQMQ